MLPPDSCQLTYQTWRILGDPRESIETVLDQKRTGTLTLHVNCGHVSAVEWRERYDSGRTLPETMSNPLEQQ